MTIAGEEINYSSKTTKGAAAELIASAYFMARGYHVFRALSATCPVDLIVWRDGDAPRRVEVKSGTSITRQMALGRVHHMFSRPRNTDWDLLVAVDGEGQVFVYPVEDFPTYEDALRDYRLTHPRYLDGYTDPERPQGGPADVPGTPDYPHGPTEAQR